MALKPTECRRCGDRLAGEDAAPLRHQVWELPEIKPLVVEYQQHRLTCSGCRTQTCAPLPPGVPAGQSGPRLIAFTALLMAYYRDGTLTRRGLQRLMKPVRNTLDGLLLRGALSGNRRLTGMCDELYGHRDWLWTFVNEPGVEPTNNVSERALRHAAIWRKLSFGTQSKSGSRFVERMLTVIESEPTTIPQHVRLPHHNPPSLLPKPNTTLTPRQGVNGYLRHGQRAL